MHMISEIYITFLGFYRAEKRYYFLFAEMQEEESDTTFIYATIKDENATAKVK